MLLLLVESRGIEFSPAGSVRFGSDVPPARHSLPNCSIPCIFPKKKHTLRCVLFFGGVEGNRTPVRKQIHEAFSGRRRLLISRDGQSRPMLVPAAFLFLSVIKANSHFMFTANRRPCVCRGTHTPNEAHLGSLCYSIIVSVYFLS